MDPPVETFWRRQLAALVEDPRRGVDVRVQAFGVADVLQDPGPEVCEAGVLGQNQTGPGVTFGHVQGGDGHGTSHLRDHRTMVWTTRQTAVKRTETVGELLPARIFPGCILEGRTAVEEGWPGRCRGRRVGWCSRFFLCYSYTPKYNW